jgi:MarR family 2-MHQ and catechol resistance regulon transcriptional repressor
MSSEDPKPYSVQLADITSRLFANCQEKEYRHATKYGISIVEFRCIRVLVETEPLTVNQLAQHMSLTSSRITRIVDGLVDKKLVSRMTGESDRRVYYLSLTKKGKELARNLIQNYIKIHDDIIKSINKEYQPIMLDALKKLNDAVENWLSD